MNKLFIKLNEIVANDQGYRNIQIENYFEIY